MDTEEKKQLSRTGEMPPEIRGRALGLAEHLGVDTSEFAPSSYEAGPPLVQVRCLAAKLDPRMLDAFDRDIRSAAQFLGVVPPPLPKISAGYADEVLTRVLGFDTSRWVAKSVPSEKPGCAKVQMDYL
jgi:hypothetical protein